MTLEQRIAALAQAIGADVKALLAALAGKAPAVHTHAISDVAGLQAALDGKQPTLAYKITVSATEPVSPAIGDIWISY